MNKSIQNKVIEIIDQEHKELYGFSSLQQLKSIDRYKTWIENGYHGNMSFLKTHIAYKEDPKKLMSQVNSAIVFSFPYFPNPKANTPFPQLRTSLYAQLDDYHFWLKNKLKDICAKLASEFPEDHFLPMTDSSPVLERDIALQAGLGWIGKNSCLIHPSGGSLFFIGEIYTSLDLKSLGERIHNFCGNCTRCVDICPTQAIMEDNQIDARKCISYLNIELKGIPSRDLRPKMKDWFFGCDLCQTVCPWNEHTFGKQEMQLLSKDVQSSPQSPALEAELREIFTSSNKSLEKRCYGSPLARARGFGLKRNAILIATNLGLINLLPHIQMLGSQEKLKELVLWSEAELKGDVKSSI
ncbi:MAG: tRNA epoxyqueuosine(34) reductase QueG [Bdellovibrionaceae bacterium]|jgi:epoxyqueuosine reductase|nr:tRNA epoxyqueuosine(34) reductase QueG [Pseudobdellovibrionaceae bacterium]